MIRPLTVIAVCMLLASSITTAVAVTTNTKISHLNLMPYPNDVAILQQNMLSIDDNNWSIHVEGDNLDRQINWYRDRIARQTGLILAPQSEDALINVKINSSPHANYKECADLASKKSKFVCMRNLRADRLPNINTDESYTLTIDNDKVFIEANSRFGAMYGMETLLQMIDVNKQLPFVKIEDKPAFKWRGLLIDTARHFIEFDTLKRQIDAMAAAKLNVLHLHLTDDQGWRFQSRAYPELTEQASDGKYYSQMQLSELVRYAALRGIRVVPEVDFPGHASAIALVYPELSSSTQQYSMERNWGVHKPLLDPSNPKVYEFIDTIIQEVTDVFPDQYIHIGGDEVDSEHWDGNTKIQEFMKEQGLQNSQDLHTFFNKKLNAILAKHNRFMLGWDEIYDKNLPKDIIIQSWRGTDSLGEIANAGYKGILSAGFYLDQPQYISYHYRNKLIPESEDLQDSLQAEEQARVIEFNMPRLKGSAVVGNIVLIKNSSELTHDSQRIRGFIDIQGRARRKIHNISIRDRNVYFNFDSWMGPITATISFEDNKLDQIESGNFLIGNVVYPFAQIKEQPKSTQALLNAKKKGQTSEIQEFVDSLKADLGIKSAGNNKHNQSNNGYIPEHALPIIPSLAKAQENILGAEAALWAENVTNDIIDIKLWPRLFAVSERMWLEQNQKNDELRKSLYSRLSFIDAYARLSVKTENDNAMRRGLLSIANYDAEKANNYAVLMQVLEPAHYYTRNHLKFISGNYHQFEPLSRLADLLSAENLTLHRFNHDIEIFLNTKDTNLMQKLDMQLNIWQQAAIRVVNYDDKRDNNNMVYVADRIWRSTELLKKLIEAYNLNEGISDKDRSYLHVQAERLRELQDEFVIALDKPIVKLLDALSVDNYDSHE